MTAFPPGKNSLNEYGFHFVSHLSRHESVGEVIVFADETPEGPPAPLPGVTAVVSWRFNAMSNLFRLCRAVRREKPDAVLFNLQFATFADTKVAGGLGLLAPALTRLLRTPTGVILHNLADNVDMQDAGFAGSAVMARVMKLAGRALTRALLLANYVALTIPRYVEFVRSSYKARNVLLSPHGSFEEIAVPSFAVPDGPRTILAFGKWGTYKTVDVLIDAYRMLRERGGDDLRLVIAGTDSPNAKGYLASVAEANPDLEGLEFTGYVAEEDVARIFGGAAVVAFPYTSTTGSSGVLHQAGEYGRAAVLPRIGDLVDIIEEEGFAGEYFEPGDPESLAAALSSVLDDESRRDALGRQNFAAATGIPMSEVVHWHVIHLQRILARRSS
ncbi:glycosyltransferase [Microbacterium aquimaris]|uniref:D-inositol 3-phosphate glycosyltransferase n=1 Tax=Microbacterium aquimaris TaxID=459816 RepID=A0ABU5N2X3_9MICO|nr:glycosyltransferase [Microbacterium aquimaris]MDZ8160430.1 glycosyltransferase [Microbacterium aquimaris]